MPIQAQYSSAALPDWLANNAKQIAEMSNKIAGERYIAYPHPRVAPLNPYLNRANEMAGQIGQHAPAFRRSGEMLEQASQAFPENYAAYRNPYQNDVVNRIGELGGRNLREQIMPQLEAAFVGLGQHGSSQHRQLGERAARDSQSEILARQSSALQQGYQQAAQMHASDQARRYQSGVGMADLGRYNQAAHLTDAAALEHAGDRTRGFAQENANDLHQQFLRERAFPRQQLAEHAATIQGLPYTQHTYTQNQFPNQASPYGAAPREQNMFGNLGSMATQLYGARMGRKMGGHIPMKGKPKSVSKKMGNLGKSPLSHSSFVRFPKVGGKHTLMKGKM